jgi:hypothetical protein
LKTYIISKSQKIKEHPLLAELCNILIHQENFGIKYEVNYRHIILDWRTAEIPPRQRSKREKARLL